MKQCIDPQETCPKCGKEGRLREIIMDNIPKKLCEDCIKRLQRKWTDWFHR